MLLTDIRVLTLYHGRMTNAKRSSPIPQVSIQLLLFNHVSV